MAEFKSHKIDMKKALDEFSAKFDTYTLTKNSSLDSTEVYGCILVCRADAVNNDTTFTGDNYEKTYDETFFYGGDILLANYKVSGQTEYKTGIFECQVDDTNKTINVDAFLYEYDANANLYKFFKEFTTNRLKADYPAVKYADLHVSVNYAILWFGSPKSYS